MKFVCERCQTKYSIADDKVRGKVLKVRCKSCSNVITVREQSAAGVVTKAAEPATQDSGRTAITSAAELQRRHAEAVKAMDGAKAQSPRRKSGPLAAIPAEALTAPGTPKAPPPSRPTGALNEEPIWFLAVDGHQTGPFTPGQLVDKVLVQAKGADVHVWNPGLGDWKPPASVPEIHALVEKKRRPSVAPPPPPTTTARRAAPALPSGAPPVATTAPPATAPVMPTGRSAMRRDSAKHVVLSEAIEADLDDLLQRPSDPKRPSGVHAVAADQPTQAPASAKTTPAAATDSAVRAKEARGRSGAAETPFEASALTAASSAPSPASPESALAGTESDALAALSLIPHGPASGVPATAEAAPAATTAPDEAAARATGTEAFFARGAAAAARVTGASELFQLGTRRHRNVKLGFGLAAVVVVVCSVVALATLRKPVSTANAEKPKTSTTGTDFAVLAQKLAEEQAQNGTPAPSGGNEPSKVVVPGRVTPSARRPPSRIPAVPRGGTLTGTTSPPPLEMTPDPGVGRGFGRADGEARVLPFHATSPKSTPSQADISRVINNNRSGIQTCYQRALMRDNTLKHGKVNVGITVGISGKVKRVTMDASPQFRSLEPCIRDVVQRWAFPSSSEEYDTEFPVVLQGNE